jgi:N4-gp56 family major capsid protein
MAFGDNILKTTTSAPGGADLFANIVQEAIFTAQERSILVPLCSVYDISASAGKTIQVPVYPTVSAALLTEGTDIAQEVSVNPTAKTITAAQYGVMALLSDVMKSSAGRNVAADIGRMLGEAIAKKQDETIAALFSGFSQTAGSAGTELTPDIILQAVTKLRLANAPGPIRGVFSPAAMYNLKKVLANAGYTTNSNAISDLGNEVLRNGYAGTVMGVDLFESAVIGNDASDDSVGALFVPQALGVAVKQGITLEVQRDASRRADEIVATATWGVGELVDAYGVAVTVDGLAT